MAVIERLICFLMIITIVLSVSYSKKYVPEKNKKVFDLQKKLELENKTNHTDKPNENNTDKVPFLSQQVWYKTSAASLKNEQPVVPIPNMPEASKSPPRNDVYYVKDENDKICALAKFNAKITIKYPTKDSKDPESEANINLPDTVIIKGGCNDTEITMILSWLGIGSGFEYKLMLQFKIIKNDLKDESEENGKDVIIRWYLSSLTFSYSTEKDGYFKDPEEKGSYVASSNTSLFTNLVNTSYVCQEEAPIPLVSTNPKHKVSVHLTKIKIRLYSIPPSLDFMPENICAHDLLLKRRFRDDTVPIAMGSTFAVIVLVVIIGYAVHRSMNDRKVEYKNVD